MRYVLCFGEYYFDRADNLSSFSAKVVMTKSLQDAEWFANAEEAEKLQRKYGGVVKSFEIELKEAEAYKVTEEEK